MALMVFNSLTQKKEEFVPVEAGKVKMYVCGPTVYDLLHVGNFRVPIFFNVVRNWFERHGYDVTFVSNLTDVDDKIIDRAKKENVLAAEISNQYIEEYRTDFKTLSIRPPDHSPKVTEHMTSIIEMVNDLLEKKIAYQVEGEVLYSVRKFPEYGKLSHRNIDDLQAGARVEVNKKKNDPLDFALWKPAKEGEPKWQAPWGEGRPGWHIECSAMIKKILGDSIDIHGGGMDLTFPHHENEIAQSEASNQKPFVKYWMHNNMITFGEKKMSKSLGNIKTARAFITEYNAEILKFMILSVHYRSLSDFSQNGIEHAISGLARIYSSLALAHEIHSKSDVDPGRVNRDFETVLKNETEIFSQCLDDDFNTPEVFACFFKVVRSFNSLVRYGMKVTPDIKSTALAFETWLRDKGTMLALFQEDAKQYLRILDDMLLRQKNLDRGQIDALVIQRNQARAAKNFTEADRVRDELAKIGIKVFDLVDGTHWEVDK